MSRTRGGKAKPERKSGAPRSMPRFALLTALFFLLGAGLGALVFFLERAWSAPPAGSSVHSLDPLPGARAGSRAADLFPHFRTGVGHFLAERFSPAYEEFTLAARLAPEDPRPLVGRGDVLRNFDRNEMAEVAYRRALELEPGSEAAIRGLARVLYEMGSYEEASALLEGLRERTPDDLEVLSQLAKIEIRRGRPERSIPLLLHYCEVGGDPAWGHERLGRAYAEAGRPREAEGAYRRALELRPKAVLCHLWLGQLLVSEGRRDEAAVLLETYRNLRRWQDEERRARRDLLRRPRDVMALTKVAYYRHRLGENHKALATLQLALDLAPEEPRLHELKALIEKELQVSAPPR